MVYSAKLQWDKDLHCSIIDQYIYRPVLRKDDDNLRRAVVSTR